MADSLGSKKRRLRKRYMPEKIKKKRGHLKRFDPVRPFQVQSPSREVVIPHVLEIVKVPQSNYAHAFHISEQPPIELYLNELGWVKALRKTKRYPERMEFHYSSGSRISWPLHKILDQDYHVLKTVYLKLDSKKHICTRSEEDSEQE